MKACLTSQLLSEGGHELKPPALDFALGAGHWACVGIALHGRELVVAWQWERSGPTMTRDEAIAMAVRIAQCDHEWTDGNCDRCGAVDATTSTDGGS